MRAEPIDYSQPIEVGVYEAKTHLSRLLDAVEQGATITITRRGRKAAHLQLVPDPPEVKKPRPFGFWEDYVLPEGWDEFTEEDEKLWYGE